jgi:hypothetical protein
VSQYRPVVVSGADAGSPTARPDIQRQRRPVPTVVTVAVATGLLSAGFIRVFEPAANHRVLSMGVYLIGAAAAVCLNAVTLGASPDLTEQTPSSRNPGRSVERVQHQRSQIASMSPDLTIRRSNDE